MKKQLPNNIGFPHADCMFDLAHIHSFTASSPISQKYQRVLSTLQMRVRCLLIYRWGLLG